MADRSLSTAVEYRIERTARRVLDAGRQPRSPVRVFLTEFLVFGAKQAWACTFGAALLVVIATARIAWPDDAPFARNDALTIAAVLIQLGMLAFGLETVRELRVVLLFHVVGTVMEVFKTDVGSWSYDGGGVLHIAGVPLFSGFMYGAVGSYMVRVYRLFDLRFERYPRQWWTVVVACGIYLNFFTHHFVWDARYLLLGAVALLFARTTLHARVHRATLRMPMLVAMALVAVFIWIAENVATWAGAWTYPAQQAAWHPVAPTKIVAWLLLMTISVALVTWLHPPLAPGAPSANSRRPSIRRAAGARRVQRPVATPASARRESSAFRRDAHLG
ncbi:MULTISPECIES: DUF817 domain-containing protein [unclassified Curtobacterium]|uniref:DUF817 domain-containing protein n=1 Tax=unclassified Curtobacterium TaxID=257496 RepID=UPI00382F33E8